ncbi:MAG: GNAT family N-acetyltransferase, partial [Microvirga sp.]
MDEHDLDRAIGWAADEGWNPGLADADCFRAADPEGFLMAWLDGEPAACLSVVRYGPAFGFLGLYIARPDRRGQGIGYRLWQAGMIHLEGAVVGLDGVPAQQTNYARSGFKLAHRNVRFGGKPGIAPPRDGRLKRVGQSLVQPVLDYDRPFFAGPREPFLRCWLRPEARTAFALVDDGAVRGYGVIRACREGYKIGPLFADGESEAEILFQALAACAGDSHLFLDLPEPNQAAIDLATRHGLSPVFETAR